MLLDRILKNLKESSKQKAYTIDNKSYTYRELNQYVSNIYEFIINIDKEKRPIMVYRT